MAKLIRQLKEDHDEIFNLLLRVKILNVDSDYGQKVMLSARDYIMEHLRREDRELYPVLDKAATTDAELKEVLRDHRKELLAVTEEMDEFFEKYSKPTRRPNAPVVPEPRGFIERVLSRLGANGSVGPPPNKEFIDDFEGLYDSLHRRIRDEEAFLYTAYSRLKG